MGSQWFDSLHLDNAYRRIASGVADRAPAFSAKTALSWGVTRAELLALQRAGHVRKIRHGAYCQSEVWTAAQYDERVKRRLLASAALACLRHPAYACGPFAAELHDLPLPPWEPTTIDLVRDAGTDVRSARDGVKPANQIDGLSIVSRNLAAEERVEIAGIPTLGLVVATMTAAARLDGEQAVVVMDATIGSGIAHEALKGAADRWISMKGMHEAIRRLVLARAGAESPLESISRLRLIKLGLPEPVLQHEFRDARGFVGRVDMWWPDWHVVGEADGLGKYDDISVLRREKVREDRLRAMGLTVVRWTWDDIWRAPGDVAARIRSARSLSSSRRNAG